MSLAALVMSSILPCPPCLPPVMLSTGGSGLQQGEGGLVGERGPAGRGGGAKEISVQLPYTALPHGASPKGTSHNKVVL